MKKVLIVGMILAVSGVVVASDEDDLTSLSYISYLERYATVLPANSEETIEAVINMPLVAGDQGGHRPRGSDGSRARRRQHDVAR